MLPNETSATIEAPLLSPKRGYIKKGCGSSCGCLLLVALVVTLIMRASWGPSKETLKTIPTSFTEQLPLFTTVKPEKIIYERDIDHSRAWAEITAFPGLFIDPSRAILSELRNGRRHPRHLISVALHTMKLNFETPGGAEAHDRITLEWGLLPDSIEKIKRFNNTAFDERGFAVRTTKDDISTYALEFYNNELRGTIEVQNYDLRHSGVEKVIITEIIPHQ